MKKQQFISILDRYLKNQATAEEHNLLHAYYHLFMADDDVLLLLKDEEKEKLKLQIKAGINARIGEIEIDAAEEPLRKVRLWPRIAVASRRKVRITRFAIGSAAAVAAIVVGVWFFNSESGVPEVNPGLNVVVNDIAPGKNGATITLANGKVIELSDAKSGVVIGNGRIAYSSLRGGTHETSSGQAKQSPLHDEVASIPRNDVMQMTANTAKGQTYQFTLPDGTKVWLNADSKLEFPSSFVSNKTRFVKLSGEGYFEVAKDKAHPFIVRTAEQEVRVLGTHFNINAYADEPAIATTLLEGSVKLTVGNSEKMLRPGEQAISDDGKIKLGKVNIDAIVDWKNEEFFLDKMDFRVAMRKIARWYNIEVIYNGSVPTNLEAGGWIPRNSKLSDVLKSIESTGQVKFKIEGKKLYVSK